MQKEMLENIELKLELYCVSKPKKFLIGFSEKLCQMPYIIEIVNLQKASMDYISWMWKSKPVSSLRSTSGILNYKELLSQHKYSISIGVVPIKHLRSKKIN